MSKNRWLFMSALQPFRCIIAAGLLFASVNTQAVTLEEAIESALKVDPTLRASKFNEMATEENIAIARSKLLPQISLQGSSSQLTQTTTQDLAAGGSASRSFTGPSVNHQFVIRQALLKPKELPALKYAELQTEYMALKYKSDVNELKSKVVNAWVDLLCAQQIVIAYEKPLQLMQAAAKQERARYENGDSTKDAVMEAEAQYQNSIATHLQAIETLKTKQSAFENLTKIPAKALIKKKIVTAALPEFNEADKAVIWQSFQNTSLELQMSKLQEQMQLERLKMAEADHKPTIDLIASLNLAQNDATSTQGYQYRNKQVGVQYTLPLFAGGGLSAVSRQASLGYQATSAEGEAFLSRLTSDFDASWGIVLSSSVRHKALLSGLSAGKEQVNSSNRGLELGVKSIADIANAEFVFARKINDLISATQEYIKTSIKIKINLSKSGIY